MSHQILGEGEVVRAVQTQMQTNRNLYDGYVNDSDLTSDSDDVTAPRRYQCAEVGLRGSTEESGHIIRALRDDKR